MLQLLVVLIALNLLLFLEVTLMTRIMVNSSFILEAVKGILVVTNIPTKTIP